jgi:uncharacterized HAD superfamily protein
MPKNPPVVGVDFDGTVCIVDMSKPYVPKTEIIGEPNIKLIKMLEGMRKEGWRIIIDSSRWWGDFNWVKDWLDKNNVPYDDIHLGRLKADLYIDDMSINVKEVNEC